MDVQYGNKKQGSEIECGMPEPSPLYTVFQSIYGFLKKFRKTLI